MLKMIIADDERVIRETISQMLDWESLGIELIGVCKNGIEVYNMILDESPDIVMTDIRMPGLSGLEVVREIAQTNQQIQFIFLSGYEEFEYAREAMKYGVKYYLLKPCSESKMTEAICQAKEDCLKVRRRMEADLRQNSLLRTIQQEAMYHLFMEGMAWKDKASLKEKVDALVEIYGQYLEMEKHTCCLYYVYYLEEKHLAETLKNLERKNIPSFYYGIYVKGVLLLMGTEEGWEETLRECTGEAASVVEIVTETFESMTELLAKVLGSVQRFETVYAIHNYKAIELWNDQNVIRYVQTIYEQMGNVGEEKNRQSLEELVRLVKEASKTEMLRIVGNGFCTRMLSLGGYTMGEAALLLKSINEEKGLESLRAQLVSMISQVEERLQEKGQDYGFVANRVMACVDEHLSECDLTLKKIAEEYLYMNVDYVSRKFRQDTGKKFSQYLTEQRVKKAKELLAEDGGNKIQYVAECVGCGNNPQYFSQIFKKSEGLTPGKWAEKMKK